MTFLQKRPVFFTNTQKHNFSLLFLIFFFHFFHVFSFSFSNIKKTKTKSAHFFSKTFFWHPDKLPKNYFRTPTHCLCFKIPKKHYRIGENKQKKILDQVLTQPWTKFWLKKPQILDQVLTLQHIYIYIHIHMAVCELLALQTARANFFSFNEVQPKKYWLLSVTPHCLLFIWFLLFVMVPSLMLMF